MSDVQYFRRNKLIVSPVRVISLCGHNGRVTWGRQGGRGLIRSDQLTAPRTRAEDKRTAPPALLRILWSVTTCLARGNHDHPPGEQRVSGGGAENGSWSKCLCLCAMDVRMS